jgi:hypothetical protein
MQKTEQKTTETDAMRCLIVYYNPARCDWDEEIRRAAESTAFGYYVSEMELRQPVKSSPITKSNGVAKTTGI